MDRHCHDGVGLDCNVDSYRSQRVAVTLFGQRIRRSSRKGEIRAGTVHYGDGISWCTGGRGLDLAIIATVADTPVAVLYATDKLHALL